MIVLLRVIQGAIALCLLWSWYRIRRRTVPAEGRVLSIGGGQIYRSRATKPHKWDRRSFHAEVEFTAHGFQRSFMHDFRDGMEEHAPGDRVRVLFDPANPKNAAVDQGPANYTPLIVGTALFLIFSIGELVGLW